MSISARRAVGWLSAALVLTAALPAAWAHHSITAKFDPSRPISLQGQVTHLNWANPHVHIFMGVQEGDRVRSWYVELESTVLLEKTGWNRETLVPGDEITVQGIVARSGSRQAWGQVVRRADSGEQVLHVPEGFSMLASREGGPVRETPRWPDGQPRLGPAPGESGYWVPASTVLVEDGADVALDGHGLLLDLGELDRVAPFQQWARDLYAYRQRNFLASDPMFRYCKPPGGPRKFHNPYGIKLVEDRPHERIFVMPGGGNRDWHLIYTDGRALNGEFGHDDGNFLYYGRNVGTWDGDTFVIESVGYSEDMWIANGGLPHTSHLRVTERLTRRDMDTMTYEVTIDDPGAYTRPWTSTWTLQWVPDADPPEYYCQDNRP